MADFLNILMFVTLCGFLLAGFPVAFTLAGTALLFAGIGYVLGAFDPVFLVAFPQRIFGTMTNDVLVAVPLFVFMGVMLERSRVAEELLDSMGMVFGSLRGGLGVSVTIVGALMAASTGIVGATVVTMGLLSLPTMLRRGYDPKLATGSICAAGTLGQIIPPSIVLVLLGDVLSSAYQQAQLSLGNFSPKTVSVGDLFAGALLPGLLLVGLYLAYQLGKAALHPEAAPAIPQAERAGVSRAMLMRRILRSLVPPILLIVAVLGSILTGVATPTEAAAVGAIGATLLAGSRINEKRPLAIYLAALGLIGLVILSFGSGIRLGKAEATAMDQSLLVLAGLLCLLVVAGTLVSLRRVFTAGILREVLRSTMQISSMVFVILIGASLLSLVFLGYHGDDMVHEFLAALPGGVAGAMILVMIVMFILGFFLDFIQITFVVVPIVAPILMQMGLDPIWLGVMMAVNLQTSFLTPPFGFALFYLRGVAPESVATLDIYRGVLPFIAIQLLALGILALFPELATWLPHLIYG
ncbi:MAG: TRAP transporter large permease subunit [Alphaproteobacteria bacterium]|nr:TRAP transporter large permease subunit [Alphaproteobacteria bacterium]